VRAWKNHVDGGAARDLADIRGNVTAVRVKIPSGEARVVRLDRDSDSALCGSPGAWGSLGGDRTFIVHLKLDGTGDGFLFDGFTWSGIARARARRGKWQAGAQPRGAENFANPDRPTLPAEAGVWQTHAFVFTHPAADDPALAKDNSGLVVRHYIAGPDGSIRSASVAARADSPQAGLVLGGLGERKSLRADLAEFVVVNDAIDETDFGKIAAGLRARWGQPEELGPATAPELISTAVPGLTRTVLRKRGDGGIHTYRIPGLATTPAGTLIAVFDCRNTRAGDLPGDIDVGLMRSTDNGQTWSRMKRILDFPAAAPGAAGNGVGDPSILVDETTGAIFVAALWSHGTRGTAGSGPGLAPEETGQFVLTKSTDDGKTWSRPINITAQVKTPAWTIFFQGPGRGITLRDGALVFPAQYIEAAGAARRFRSCFIYSADHGETWKTSAPAVPGDTSTSESQIAQLADGALLLSMRCEGGAAKGRRLWARYDWTGTLANGTWSAPWSDLPDPTCQASLLAHPAGPLLFANIANPDHRRDLTIRASADGGKTWNTGRLLDPRPSAYSCLTALKDGTVAILYETGEVSPYETLAFARFPLEWITTAP
jgi:sialidase-1